MDNRVLGEVLAEYAAQREKNEQEEQRRQQEIAAKAPQIAALMQQRHQMIMGSVRGAFAGTPPENAEARMREYNQKIAKRLSGGLSIPGGPLQKMRRYRLCVRWAAAPGLRLPEKGVSGGGAGRGRPVPPADLFRL